MKQITETRMLRYNFTPEEHLKNTDEMTRLYDHLAELEANSKSIKASLKEQEEAAGAELGRMVRLVRDKCEHRKTECRWLMDVPAVGQKTLRRNDTDVDVEVRRMEDHERQESLNLVLPLDGEAPAADPEPDKPAEPTAEEQPEEPAEEATKPRTRFGKYKS